MKPTYEELETELKNTRALLEKALATIVELEERIKKLEDRLNTNSKNSSKPPSSDQKANTTNEQAKKKKPRSGFHRTPYSQEEVDSFVSCTRDCCPHCQSTKLQKLEEKPLQWQQVELPKVSATITQYDRVKYRCFDCKKRSLGDLPKGVPYSSFGPRLMAFIATLTGCYHLSKREAIQMIEDIYGLKKLSEGSVINVEENVADSLKEVYERIHHIVIKGGFAKYLDETSWRDSGKRHYAWIAATDIAALFRIDRRRSGEALLQLTKSRTDIPIVTDRYSAYNAMDGPRQYCLAHLIRDFRKFAESTGKGGAMASEIEKALREVCRIHRYWRQGKITRRQYGVRLSHKRAKVENLLIDGFLSGSEKFSNFCERLMYEDSRFWTFIKHKDMEPTNNMAERDLRKLVLWRKKSYGTRSERGKKFVERITSVVESLKKNKQNVFDFLTRAVKAFYSDQSSPFIEHSLGF